MKLPFTKIKDLVYNQRLTEAFVSKDYENTKEYSDVLNKPLFTLQDSQLIIRKLTYRKINDWDAKDLISYSRDKETSGWRKFSILDVIRLNIVSDLRDYGFPTEKIKAIIENVSSAKVYLQKAKTNGIDAVDFMQIEYFTMLCFSGIKMLLLIDEDDKVYFVPEQGVMGVKSFFNDVTAPLIVLPFFSYAENIASIIFEQKTVVQPDTQFINLFNNQLEEKEKKLLELIRDKDYEEITIVKSDGDKTTLKATTRKGGAISEKDVIATIREKDYQIIRLAKVNGQIVSVIREEPIKV